MTSQRLGSIFGAIVLLGSCAVSWGAIAQAPPLQDTPPQDTPPQDAPSQAFPSQAVPSQASPVQAVPSQSNLPEQTQVPGNAEPTETVETLTHCPLDPIVAVPEEAPAKETTPASAEQIEQDVLAFLRRLWRELIQQHWHRPEGSDTTESPLLPPKAAYQAIDEFHRPKFKVNSSQVFSPGRLPNVAVQFQEKDLLSVLENTRAYFSNFACQADPDSLREGILGTQGITLRKIVETLDFAIATLQADIAEGKPTRLKDANFVNTHFNVVRWSAFNPQKPGQSRLRITKYAVFSHTGSRSKTATYNTPIYALNDPGSDANDLGSDANNPAPTETADLFYKKYTKQQVLSGIYEPGGREYGKATPLAYLTRTGLEDALLQGTILIRFPDGSSAYFNVDRNNGIAYAKGVAQRAQKRYWYFKEVDAIKGYGYNAEAKISIRPGVTFAGDVLNLGLGKLIVLRYTIGGQQRLKLGAIADTGGAFLPNLYQLDLLAGVFPSKQAFSRHIQQLPSYADAYILIKK